MARLHPNQVTLPEIRIGELTRCGTLAVFPLYPERTLFPGYALDYQLSDESQHAGTCFVREVSKEGKVGELLVENTGDRPVLFLEGEELKGAKQNRVMRSSVLAAARSQIVVPVFCVESGRWSRSSGSLKTGSHSPPSLRHLLKGGSMGTGMFRRMDGQMAVWQFIAAKHQATGTGSPKGNMADALSSRPEVVQKLRRELPYPEGATGIAVVIGGRTVGIDLFDKPSTLEKVWDRLVVLGLTLDAADLRDADCQEEKPVRLYMETIRSMRWREVATVGLGQSCRAADSDGSLATALFVDGVPIHLSVSMPAQEQEN